MTTGNGRAFMAMIENRAREVGRRLNALLRGNKLTHLLIRLGRPS